MRLAEPLRTWQAELEGLPDEAIDAIGPMLGHLRALVGPMLQRPEPGGGEPDGLTGLTRRGPWERLSISEWAVSDVAPDEFLRRATSGEQLFQELGYHTPQAGRSCRVLLDAGPDQLGQPRLVQLALLVVLARRAAEAGAAFLWGPLQGAQALEGWGQEAVSEFLAARTLQAPTEAGLRRHLPDELGPEHELWVVGGDMAVALGGAGARRVRIELSWQGDELGVQLSLPGGSTRAIQLPALPAVVAKQVFRRPWMEPSPPPSLGSHRWHPGFRFSEEGSRLLGVLSDGAIVAAKVHRAKRSRRPKVRHPGPGRLVAVGWHDQKPLWIAHHGRDRLGGLWRAPEWAAVEAPQGPAGTVVHHVSSWTTGDVARWVTWIGPAGEVCRLQYAVSDTPERLPMTGLALGRRSGVPVLVATLEGSTRVYEHHVRDREMLLMAGIDGEARAAWLGPSTFVGRENGRHYGLIGVQLVEHEVLVLGLEERVAIPLARGDRVWGVTWLQRQDVPDPALLVSGSGGRLHLVSAHRRQTLPHEGHVVYACASPGNEPLVAWMTEDARIVVYSVQTERAVERLAAGGAP